MSERTTRSSRALNGGLRHSILKDKNNKVASPMSGNKRINSVGTNKSNMKKLPSPKKFKTILKTATNAASTPCSTVAVDSSKSEEPSEVGSSICDRTIYPDSISSSYDFVGDNILDGLSSSGSSSFNSEDFVFEGRDCDVLSVWSLGSYSNRSFGVDSSTPTEDKCESFDINDPHNFFGTERAIREAERRNSPQEPSTTLSSLTEQMALSSSSSPASDKSDLPTYGLRSLSRKH